MDAESAPIGQPRFAPGHIFAGRYRIVSLLGRGAMGEVYRADDLRLEQTVALKLLAAHGGADEAATLRFAREVRLARGVAHPNVCRVYDIGDADGWHYLSMEYVDGETLASLLHRIGRLPREKALDIARQLCAGLAAAHDQGVLHRDLKPANIMVDGRGRIRIMDFGLAVASDDPGVRESAGTPGYMAPEQLTGGHLSERTDLFAFGLVLYELFAGRPFYTGRSLVRGDTPPNVLLQEIDGDVAAIVAACVDTDVRNRPPSAIAVAAALPTTHVSTRAAAPAAVQDDAARHDAITVMTPVGTLRPAVAWLLLAAVVAGTIGIASRAPIVTIRSSDVPKPPEVLAAQAREMLQRIGAPGVVADNEFWFTADNSSPDRRPPIQFVYRSSPRALIPRNLFHIATEDDPPFDVPDMASVVLDANGGLVRFSWLDDPQVRAGANRQVADWHALFAEAGLDDAAYVPVNPDVTPPVPHDRVLVWQRRADRPDQRRPPRVVGATIDGRPVFFDVTGAVNRRSVVSRNVLASGRPAVTEAALWAFILVAFTAAAALARRTLQSGEGDRASARKLSIFVAGGGLLYAMLRAHHVPSIIDEVTFALGITGWVLVWTAFCWLIYIAVDPPIRRLWPPMLFSLSRLLAGRVRDPLVGRDVLVGALGGVAFVAIIIVRFQIAGRNPPDLLLNPTLESLRSSRHFAAALAFQTTDVLQFLLGGLLFLVLLQSLVKNRWLTGLLWVVLATPVSTGAPFGAGAHLLGWDLVFAAALGVFGLAMLVRFGMLATLVMLVIERLVTRLPVTLDLDAWYLDSSFTIVFLVFALAIYGFIVALGDQPAVRT
jgi:serine/threonine-protein kinase